MGHLAQLGMSATTVADEAFEFLTETLALTETQTHSNGIRGHRSRQKSRVRTTREAVAGSITMNPTATELDLLLPRIFGGDTILADTLPETFITVDRVAKVFEYVKCVCGQGVISGSSGQPLQLVTDWEGETETVTNAGTFPEITPPTDGIFVFSDIVLTLDGTPREVDEFSLTINNLLSTELYRNAISREEIPAADREVTLSATLPYDTANVDLYDAAIAGAAGSLVFSDGSDTYTFILANVKIPAVSPNVSAKDDIPLAINANIFAEGDTLEIDWTKT
jgi:hypothetical protein